MDGMKRREGIFFGIVVVGCVLLLLLLCSMLFFFIIISLILVPGRLRMFNKVFHETGCVQTQVVVILRD